MEKKSGLSLGELTMGSTLLIHRYLFRTLCIRYEDIESAFLRIQCTGGDCFAGEDYALIVRDPSGKEHSLHVDYRQYAEEAMAWMAEHAPHIRLKKTPL